MRKVNAMIGVTAVCLILLACQPLQRQSITTLALFPSPSPTPTARRTPTPTWGPIPSRVTIPAATPFPTVVQSPLYPALSATSPCEHRQDVAWRTWRNYYDYEPWAISTLLVEQGDLWVGTRFGVFRVDLHANTSVLSPDSQSVGRVFKLLPLGSGRLWASTTNGQFYYDGQAWAAIALSDTLRFSTILGVDQNGDVLLLGKQNRSYFCARLPGHVPPPDRVWEAVPEAFSIYSNAENCEWQAFSNATSSGLPYRSPQECQALWQAKQKVESIFSRTVNAVPDGDASIWWILPGYGDCGVGPLGHLAGNAVSLVALPVKCVYAIVPDPRHGVWLGTDMGLAYSDGQSLRWASLGMEECALPAPPNNRSGLSIDATGTAWFIAVNGAYDLPSHEMVWRFVSVPSHASSVSQITPAAGGGIWATHGDDLFSLGDILTTTHVMLPDSQCGVTQLAADSKSVWVYSPLKKCGLLQFDLSTGNWVRHDVGKGDVGSVLVGSDGIVYAGGRYGLYAYTGSAWSQVVQQDISVAVADRQGGVWIASRQPNKLWYWKAGQATPRELPPGYSQLAQLAVDGQNRLWAFSLDRGVLWRYDGKAWQRVDPPIHDIRELTSGPDGRVWVLGASGVAVYDPAADMQP
jgi:ligand-binding sensor domain-containing protein